MNYSHIADINNLFKKYENKANFVQLCERCFNGKNILICEICKLFYHLECEYSGKKLSIPPIFLCSNCKNFKSLPSTVQKQNYIENSSFSMSKLKSQSQAKSQLPNISNKTESFVSSNVLKASDKPQQRKLPVISRFESGIDSNAIHSKRRKKRQNQEDTLVSELLEGNQNKFDLLNQKRALHNFENTDINFKKRKIRVGDDYNITNKEEENLIEDCFTSLQQPKKIFSGHQCPLSKEAIDKFIRDAYFFWDHRNITIENDLCSEFYNYYDDYCKKIDDEEVIKILKFKYKCVKSLVSMGVTMNNHFEEMALRILHLTGYSTKKAIFLIYSKINPFLEEEIEGFKSDVTYMQREVFTLIKDYEMDKAS